MGSFPETYNDPKEHTLSIGCQINKKSTPPPSAYGHQEVPTNALHQSQLTLIFCIGVQLQEVFPYGVVVQGGSNKLKGKKVKAKKVTRPEVNSVTLE